MERGIRTTAVSGSYQGELFEDFQSHTWLLDDRGFALDITGDQFRNSATFLNFRTKVYYGPEGEFHMLFKDRRLSTKVGIFEQYNEPARSSLLEAYDTILQYL